jgi:hypothetical protein
MRRGRTAPPTPLFIGRIERLPTSLMDTISVLCDNPIDHYAELQNILLQSYSFNAAQKTVRLLNHPGLETNKPSVPMDQLIAFEPDSLMMSSKSCFSGKCPDTWLLTMSSSFAATRRPWFLPCPLPTRYPKRSSSMPQTLPTPMSEWSSSNSSASTGSL